MSLHEFNGVTSEEENSKDLKSDNEDSEKETEN